MVEISQHPHAIDKREFVIISDGELHRGDKTGIVQMNFRLSNFKSEGKCLFIDTTDETLEAKGDFTPCDIEADELNELINYLIDCYNRLKD